MPVSELVRKELDIAAQAAVNKLGTDLVAIDLSDQSLLSEAFLIVSGNNPKQVEAIADEIEEKLKEITLAYTFLNNSINKTTEVA